MKSIREKVMLVIFLSLYAMGTMSYGSFNPTHYGFWLSICFAVTTVSSIYIFFHYLRKHGYLKDK